MEHRGSAPTLSYRPHLDGLRAVAVLMVFVFHSARPAMPGGFIGVDVFFVLSGYLITRILIRRAERDGRIDFADFYARRIRRLMPAVILLVIGVVMREAIWGSVLELGTRLRETVAVLFYYANWNLIGQADEYFLEAAAASPLRHAWSLAVEEQFYLLWPLALLILLKFARSRRARIGLVVAAVAGSAILMAQVYDPSYVARAYYGTDSRIQQPLLGALLAFWWHGGDAERRLMRFARPLALGGLVGLLVMSVSITGASPFYYLGGSTLVAVLTVALIAGLEADDGSLLGRSLSSAPMRELGKISYGFYLWHWPVIVWLTAPVGADFLTRRMVNGLQFAITLGLAIGSYVVVERPVREGAWAFGKLGPKLTVAAGVLALGVTAVVASVGLRPAGGGLAEAALADRSYEPCPDNPQPCVKVEGDGADPYTVVLIGDSTAQSYDPALKLLAEEHGFRYVQAAVGGCPIGHRFLATGTDGELHKSSNYTCYEEMPGIYRHVLDTWDPDLIVATSWNETNQHVDGEELIESGTPRHLTETEAALRDAVALLTSRGASFAFIDILPPGPSVSCLDTGGPDEPRCRRAVAADSVEKLYNALFAKIAGDTPRVVDVSLTDRVCPDGVCPLMVNGVVMRYDGGHLTGTASERLAPILEIRMADAGVTLARAG